MGRKCGLAGASSRLAAVDSTGLETRHVSRYFSHRRGCLYSRYPKLSVVTDADNHLFLAAVVDRGPRHDQNEFRQVVIQAHRRQPFKALLGDVAYDSEANHRFLYEHMGVVGVFPPTRGQAFGRPVTSIRTYYRRILAEHWPIAEYGQRWQVETSFSMLKRLLGSSLRCRRRHTIDREIRLRVLTINLMIILCTTLCFQQSRVHRQLPYRFRPALPPVGAAWPGMPL